MSAVACLGVPACGGSSSTSPWTGGDAGGSSVSSGGVGSSGGSSSGATAPTGAASAPASPSASTSPPAQPGDGTVDASTHSDGASPVSDGSVPSAPVGSVTGTAYKGVANSACNDLVTLGATWYYNWETSPGSCAASQFVPMIWGHTGTEQSALGVASERSSLVSAGYHTILGFNEPDNSSQSNIAVADALALWPSMTADPSVLVGSPATQANTSGQAWFTSFMKAVNADTTGQLRVDFISAHWYGWNSGSCDAKAASLESYVKWLEGITGNRPIWLTEWGCLNDSNPTAAVVQAFFTGAVAMFAKHPRLVRYAWYPWTTNNELVASDDTLTDLGKAFVAAPAQK